MFGKSILYWLELSSLELNFAAEVAAVAKADKNMNYLSSLNMLLDTATLYPKEDVSSSSSSLSLLLHRFCIPHPIAVITSRAITPKHNF
jgi:hypothetical protein